MRPDCVPSRIADLRWVCWPKQASECYHATGSYRDIFIFSGLSMVVAALLMSKVHPQRRQLAGYSSSSSSSSSEISSVE